jgi:hypothetical protein
MAGTRRNGLTDAKFRVRTSTDEVRQPTYLPPIESPSRRLAWGVVVWLAIVLAAVVMAAWWLAGEGPGVRP